MASSSEDSKCPCCLRKYYSEYKPWFQHIKDCSLEKFKEKVTDHNIQMSQKYIISCGYSMCQAPLESQLKVIQHINDCAPVYAMHLGLDDPSLVSNFSDSTHTSIVALSWVLVYLGKKADFYFSFGFFILAF